MERESHFTNYSFVCPESRVAEAINLLREEAEGVAFVLVGNKTVRIIAGEDETIKGIEIHGLCLKDQSGRNFELLILLSKKGIAGYSRATQVSFSDEEEVWT